MKTVYIIMLSFGFLTLYTGCNSIKYQSRPGIDTSYLGSIGNLNPALSLSDHLRKLPGVSIVGSGQNTKVIMSGFKTYLGDPEPLFVIDRNMISGGYLAAAGAVDVNDIQSIRVVRDVNERAQYGFRGSNGVIEINTKK